LAISGVTEEKESVRERRKKKGDLMANKVNEMFRRRETEKGKESEGK